MNELISIRENKGKQVVSARELYLSLGYDSSNYSRWVKSNIIENPYSIEGEDWTPLVTNDEPINQNVNPTKDYAITIVMAKKIAMMSKTEIGNKIRDYFIECEKKSQLYIPKTYSEALMLAAKQAEEIENQQKQITSMKPKAEYFDEVIDRNGLTNFRDTAKLLGVSEQRKEAILEYLKESDEFHKLICDITGVERKQQKVSAELEKLKEEYSHMCESYENEKQQRNDLLRKCREKTVKIMKMQTTLEESCSHHNNMMNRIKDLLKEVDMPSVKHTIEALKTERANGKLLAEDIELCRRENDRLKQRYDNVCNEIKEIEKNRDNLSDNYDRLIEDYNCLNTRYNNQKEYIAKYIEENKRLIDKVEKLKGRLNRAAKNYGELIKAINDKAMKSI